MEIERPTFKYTVEIRESILRISVNGMQGFIAAPFCYPNQRSFTSTYIANTENSFITYLHGIHDAQRGGREKREIEYLIDFLIECQEDYCKNSDNLKNGDFVYIMPAIY
jgi:hypothetical protein